jgi:chromosome segregation ATPase
VQQQELLSNLENAAQAAQLKQSRLTQQIDHQTETLLAEQAVRVVQAELEATDLIKALEHRPHELEVEIAALTTDRARVQGDIVALTAELEAHHAQLAEIKTAIESESHRLEKLRAKQVGVNAQLTALQADTSKATEAHQALLRRATDLERSVGAWEAQLETTTAQYEVDKVERERELADLEHQSEELIRQIQLDEANWTAVREDLALRHTKLNERETVLERRELKVSRDERNVARNIDLLQL